MVTYDFYLSKYYRLQSFLCFTVMNPVCTNCSESSTFYYFTVYCACQIKHPQQVLTSLCQPDSCELFHSRQWGKNKAKFESSVCLWLSWKQVSSQQSLLSDTGVCCFVIRTCKTGLRLHLELKI